MPVTIETLRAEILPAPSPPGPPQGEPPASAGEVVDRIRWELRRDERHRGRRRAD
jgi:hypothetical protein